MSILQAGGFKITGGKYAPKKPDQNTDNSKGGESARFKPTNSPESESLAYPEGSSSIPPVIAKTKNSPKEELLVFPCKPAEADSSIVAPDTKNFPADSSSIPDLRLQIADELLSVRNGKAKPLSWTLDELTEYVVGKLAAHDEEVKALGYVSGYKDGGATERTQILDKVEGLIPEKATETNSLGKHYTGYSKGYNDVIDELRTEIAKLRKGGA